MIVQIVEFADGRFGVRRKYNIFMIFEGIGWEYLARHSETLWFSDYKEYFNDIAFRDRESAETALSRVKQYELNKKEIDVVTVIHQERL